MPRNFRLILAAGAVGVLYGCASPPPPPPETPDESRRMIEHAIARSAVLPQSTSSADAKPAAAVMAGKGGFYITFAGEAKDLLRRVAVARGLAFRVRGPQPHLPLFVIVDAKNVPFEEFLADVGAQFGQRADLAITNEAIEVRYRD